MIKEQGEDAECAAWIYTKNDCHLKDEDGETDYDHNVEDVDVLQRIFYQVGDSDYIYQCIQDEVDEATEEQLKVCLLYTSPSPRDLSTSRMPSSA